MDNKKHWKRGKETYIGSPILFYILQRSQGKSSKKETRKEKLESCRQGKTYQQGDLSFSHDVKIRERVKHMKS